MLTSPTWLPTGLNSMVQGLIDCVTLPESGRRNEGIADSLSIRSAAAVARCASQGATAAAAPDVTLTQSLIPNGSENRVMADNDFAPEAVLSKPSHSPTS